MPRRMQRPTSTTTSSPPSGPASGRWKTSGPHSLSLDQGARAEGIQHLDHPIRMRTAQAGSSILVRVRRCGRRSLWREHEAAGSWWRAGRPERGPARTRAWGPGHPDRVRPARGTTINRGPAPVRTLVGAARLVRDTQAWPAFGLRGPAPKVDLAVRLANAGRVADSAHTCASTRPRSSRSRPVAVAANLRVEQLAELRLAFPTFTEAPGYGRPAAGPRAGGGPPAAFAERSCPSVPARRKSP